MAQFSRPSADDTDGDWTAQDGSAVLYLVIDETSADNADYIRSGINPTGSVAKIKLSTIGDPWVNTTHILRYRVNKIGSDSGDVFVRLLQGITIIARFKTYSLSETITDVSQTLTTTQAGLITDYSNLYIEVEAHSGYPPLNSLEYVGTFDFIRNRTAIQDRIIQQLYIADNELWPSYGDLSNNTGSANNPALLSMNPTTGAVTEHDSAVPTEFFMVYQLANGDLIVPYTDPTVGSWPMYQKRISGVWSAGGSTPGGVHIFDVIEWGGNVYMCGSDQPANDRAVVWKSTDGGGTWAIDLTWDTGGVNDLDRIYTFFDFGTRLYVQPTVAGDVTANGYYTTGTGWTQESTAFPFAHTTSSRETHERSKTVAGYVLTRLNTKTYFSTSTPIPDSGSYLFSNGMSGTFYRAPTDRSSVFASLGVSAVDYDATANGNRIYYITSNHDLNALTQPELGSSDAVIVLSSDQLPPHCRPTALTIYNNVIYVGDDGGRVWKAVKTPFSRSGVFWGFGTGVTTTGWTETDTTNQMNTSTGSVQKLFATGGSAGDPRVIYTAASFTRDNTLRAQFGVRGCSASAYFHAGLMKTSTPGMWSDGGVTVGRQNGTLSRANPGTGAVTLPAFSSENREYMPGMEYLCCALATGSVIYAKGYQFEPPYDDNGTNRAIWLPIGREHLDTTSPLWLGLSVDGTLSWGLGVDYLWQYNGTALVGDLEDDFTRADSTTTPGTATVGGTWTEITGNWGISTNQAYSTDTGGSAVLAGLNPGDADGLLHCTVSGAASTSHAGVMFRGDGTNQNYWRAYYDGTNFKVDKVVSGTPTNVHSAADTATSGIIQITLYRDKIGVHKGAGANTYVTTITDNALQTNTQHGLYALQTAANARFDTFRFYGPMAD